MGLWLAQRSVSDEMHAGRLTEGKLFIPRFPGQVGGPPSSVCSVLQGPHRHTCREHLDTSSPHTGTDSSSRRAPPLKAQPLESFLPWQPCAPLARHQVWRACTPLCTAGLCCVSRLQGARPLTTRRRH